MSQSARLDGADTRGPERSTVGASVTCEPGGRGTQRLCSLTHRMSLLTSELPKLDSWGPGSQGHHNSIFGLFASDSIPVPGFVNHNSCNWSVAILKVIAVFIVFVAASG